MSPSSDVLRSFLEHPDRPAGTLGLEELQGFLFAVANAPELIVPSEWLPAVFGDSEPAFENGEEARTITTALMDEYNAVNDASLDSPDTLPPGCVIQDDPVANLEGRAPLSRWSNGFRQGHVWLEETWDEYLPDEDSELEREFTFVLIVLSFFSSRRMAEALCAETGANDVAAVAATMVEAFPAAVSQYVEIGRTMQGELTEASEPHRRAGPKIGRNEPCPCGSGRRYKRCCGAPA